MYSPATKFVCFLSSRLEKIANRYNHPRTDALLFFRWRKHICVFNFCLLLFAETGMGKGVSSVRLCYLNVCPKIHSVLVSWCPPAEVLATGGGLCRIPPILTGILCSTIKNKICFLDISTCFMLLLFIRIDAAWLQNSVVTENSKTEHKDRTDFY